MKKAIEMVIRLRNPSFLFDSELNNTALLQFVWIQGWNMVRAMRLLIFFRSPKWAMFGPGVRLFNLPGISWGNFLKLGKHVYISALGKEGIAFGNNVGIGAYSSVVVSTSLNNLGKHIRIGNNVGIGEYAYLGGAGGLDIGDDCIIGQYLSCHPENHNYEILDTPIRLQGVTRKGIMIGSNCWIGSKVTILDGVTVGNGCVIAAGAVVTKSFPEDSIIGGVPAKLIKKEMNKFKTILATTYAVNPYKGSEDGMGWNFVYQIARFNKVVAVTRQNNQPHIEAFMEENPDGVYKNMRFVYFDLPYWMRFWKKKGRGAMLYFWMWQRSIPRFISSLNITFDITHNLNFHNDWTPSYLWKLKKPFVWGPIGHHPQIPSQYLAPYNKSYKNKDKLTWAIKKFFWKYSRALKMTAKKADHVLCMNKSVPVVLPEIENKYTTMPSVATEDFGYEPVKSPGKFTLVSAGRLVPLKGFDLTISAFAEFSSRLNSNQKANCELLIIGNGPEKAYYQELAKEKGVDKQIRFINWIDRKDLMELLKDTSIFVFPSHEGAGMIVAEALSFGVPVICLDNCGPGEFIDQDCGISVPEQDYFGTVKALSEGIHELYDNPQKLKQMSASARHRFKNYFDWSRRGETLNAIYQNL